MLSYQSAKNIHLHWRRTKIIATLGPASNTENAIGQLIDEGANIFRLNMSHGTHEEHRLMAEKIRKVAVLRQKHIGILMDLCGPKIRVGLFENDSINLNAGDNVIVDCSPVVGRPGLIPSQYISLYKDVSIGERILLDDGKLELKVVTVEGKQVMCEVIYGGILRNKKGLNLPDSKISTTSFTEKDKKDVAVLNLEVLTKELDSREADVKVLNEEIAKQIDMIEELQESIAIKESQLGMNDLLGRR